jgi:hypothetical protein
MTAVLDFQHESLSYTASFAVPPFEFWGGTTGGVVKQLYDALAPYKVKLGQIQLNRGMATAGDTIVTVKTGNTTVNFSCEQLEVVFASFSEAEFQGIPSFLEAATGWIPTAANVARFVAHQFTYHSHSLLKGTTADDFLRNLTKDHAGFGGLNIGGGLILHRVVPDKKWRVELIIDKSKPIAGAIYIGLTVFIDDNKLNYESLLADGRKYFREILEHLGLELPVGS